MSLSILVIHGPNLNLLGVREPKTYGAESLAEINANLQARAAGHDVRLEIFQSNHEGEIVEKIQDARDNCDGLIINPAAYTHTSVAIRDALLLLSMPIVEIHLSNIYKREPFRHASLTRDVVSGQIAGFGGHGYLLALDALVHLLTPSR